MTCNIGVANFACTWCTNWHGVCPRAFVFHRKVVICRRFKFIVAHACHSGSQSTVHPTSNIFHLSSQHGQKLPFYLNPLLIERRHVLGLWMTFEGKFVQNKVHPSLCSSWNFLANTAMTSFQYKKVVVRKKQKTNIFGVMNRTHILFCWNIPMYSDFILIWLNNLPWTFFSYLKMYIYS